MNIDEMTTEQVETEARKQGWKPESEWQGEPPKRGFVSAEDFLKVGDESLPVVTKERDELRDALNQANERIDKIESQSGRYREFMDKALSAERRRVQQEKQEKEALLGRLQEEKAEAISEADGQKVLDIEKRMDNIKESMPPDVAEPDPEIETWMDENKWYKDDPDLAAVADGISIQLRRERPSLDGRGHLDELSKRVKEMVPHKFENPNKRDAPPVGGGKRGGGGGGKTFEDLPRDAKQAYEDFKEMIENQGGTYTKKEYLANYEWDE